MQINFLDKSIAKSVSRYVAKSIKHIKLLLLENKSY